MNNTRPITFAEAYNAATELSVKTVSQSPASFIRSIFYEAIVREFVDQLRQDRDKSIEEARKYIRKSRSLPEVLPEVLPENRNSVRQLTELFKKSKNNTTEENEEDGYGWTDETSFVNASKKQLEEDFGAKNAKSPIEKYTFVSELPKPAEVKTPTEWCKLLNKTILDADGWRGPMAKNFNESITKAEFEWRLLPCTQILKAPLEPLVATKETIPF